MAKKARAGSKAKETPSFRWLGFPIYGTDRGTFLRHALELVILSITMKLVIVLITVDVFSSFIDSFDTLYYLNYALMVLWGKIPYVQFSFDYPQGAFVSILLPLLLVTITGGLPGLLAGDPTGYILLHQGLMILFDLGSTVLIYLIGLSLYSEKRAFSAGLLSATAFSAAYFVITKYDAYPTFFILLSVALFIYRREAGGYLASAWGFVVKWFPALALPLFVITEVKNRVDRKVILWHLLLSVLVILVTSLPFLALNPVGFLGTYAGRAGSTPLTHSFVFYLDFLAGSVVFGKLALILTAASELCLFAWYYRQPRRDSLALTASVFMAVFLFIITNPIASPQYLLWLTPFMALFLAGSAWDVLLFFVVQAWGYLEFPLLYNGIYNNIAGYGPGGTGFPVVAFLFFTVKFALLFLVFGLVLKRTLAPPIKGKAETS